MTACPWSGCAGTVEETGFCDTCGRQPPAGAVDDSASTARLSGGDPRSLPVFEFADPSTRVLNSPGITDRSAKCARCGAEVGRGHAGGPGLSKGFCGKCGHPYSLLPSLEEKDVVADQYEVIGCFARGGLGWVYLARDRHLDDTLVVLKGLIDVSDTALAAAERRALTTIDHKNIVRILNFVSHPDRETGEPREYIVMEYVDGLVLSQVRKQWAAGREPLRVEHVITCVLQVLEAFEYLHGRDLLYCDMKPDNVIVRPGHHGGREDRIKLIDLGAVRRVGDRTSRTIGADGYQVSRAEINDRGLTVQSDIHTLGVMLGRMFHATADWSEHYGAAPGRLAIGLESFHRVCARAAHPIADKRFATARQMADQLEGVQREIASLRDGVARPEPSTVFSPTAVLLDAGLGSVPPLDRWTRPGRYSGTGAPLPDGRPKPAAVAVGLPVPRVDPADPAADALAVADPRRLLDKTAGLDTVEIHFARCRAHLESGDLDGADESLRRISEEDWRLVWHHGLLALAQGRVTAAETGFDEVCDALPGEDAPKLALGFCAEHQGELDRAEGLYEAVWRRDRSQGSAAFGLARIRLAHHDRAGAVAVLDEVPEVSRHHDAAAVAAVVILSGQLDDPPAPDDLREAVARLPRLYLDGGDDSGDARDRLTTILREAAHGLAGAPGVLDSGPVFGERPNEEGLPVLLEQSYRDLARQARDAEDHGVLVDLANEIRPRTPR